VASLTDDISNVIVPEVASAGIVDLKFAEATICAEQTAFVSVVCTLFASHFTCLTNTNPIIKEFINAKALA
jgi:hypothetical protein